MCVALFYSTSLALRAEKVAMGAGCECKLIPTPRHLSSDCGTALRFRRADRETLERAFGSSKVAYDRIAML